MTASLVGRLSWVLVAVAIALRAWVQISGGFRQQDFVALDAGRAALSDPALVLTGGDPVSSPLAVVASAVVTAIQPLGYLPAAAIMVLLWAAVALLGRHVLLDIVGPRPAVLVPLAFVLLGVVTVPGTSWWSTAVVTSVGLIGALLITWSVARPPRTRTSDTAWLIAGTVLVLLAAGPSVLSPWALLPVVGLAVAAALSESSRWTTGIASVVRTQAVRWVIVIGALAAWGAWCYLAGGIVGDRPLDAGPYASFVGRGVMDGVAGTLLGGPLDWFEGGTGLPVAAPPIWLVALGAQSLLLLAAAAAVLRPRVGRVWAVTAVSVVAMLALAALETRVVFPEAAGTLLALAPATVPLTIALALSLMPRRGEPEPSRMEWARRASLRARPFLIGALVLDLAAVAAVMSTVAWRDAWRSPQASDWLTTAQRSVADADPAVPLLPQAVPPYVVSPLLAPANLTSTVLGSLTSRPPFGEVTTRLTAFDSSGALRSATLAGIRPEEGPPFPCGWPAVDGVATVALGRDLPEFTYVVRVATRTTGAGLMTLRLGRGDSVTVPLTAEPTTQYVRLTGSGGELIAEIPPGDFGVCLASIVIGQVVIPDDVDAEQAAPEAGTPAP